MSSEMAQLLKDDQKRSTCHMRGKQMVISHLSYQFSLTGMLSQVRLSYKVIFPSWSNSVGVLQQNAV